MTSPSQSQPLSDQELFSKYDVDGNGVIDKTEALLMIRDVRQLEKDKSNLKKTLILTVAFAVVLLFSAFGLSWSVAVMTRKIDVQGNQLVVEGTHETVATTTQAALVDFSLTEEGEEDTLALSTMFFEESPYNSQKLRFVGVVTKQQMMKAYASSRSGNPQPIVVNFIDSAGADVSTQVSTVEIFRHLLTDDPNFPDSIVTFYGNFQRLETAFYQVACADGDDLCACFEEVFEDNSDDRRLDMASLPIHHRRRLKYDPCRSGYNDCNKGCDVKGGECCRCVLHNPCSLSSPAKQSCFEN